jgi:hypothetical protein
MSVEILDDVPINAAENGSAVTSVRSVYCMRNVAFLVSGAAGGEGATMYRQQCFADDVSIISAGNYSR